VARSTEQRLLALDFGNMYVQLVTTETGPRDIRGLRDDRLGVGIVEAVLPRKLQQLGKKRSLVSADTGAGRHYRLPGSLGRIDTTSGDTSFFERREFAAGTLAKRNSLDIQKNKALYSYPAKPVQRKQRNQISGWEGAGQ